MGTRNRPRPPFPIGQNLRPRAEMARLVNRHLPDQPRIQKFVHLGVMCENQALLAEAAPVFNADQETVRGVNPSGSREIYALADMYSHGSQFVPTALQAGALEAHLPRRNDIQ